MARSERDNLLELWDKNICPNCGEQIPEHCRIGSGKKADGGFCSLECYAKYYQVELSKRAGQVAAFSAPHRVHSS